MNKRKDTRTSREICLWIATGVLTVLVFALLIYQFPYLLSNMPETTAVTVESPSNVSVTKQINVNTASVEEIQAVVGIDREAAEAIVRFRAIHGRLQSPEDIHQVTDLSVLDTLNMEKYFVVE